LVLLSHWVVLLRRRLRAAALGKMVRRRSTLEGWNVVRRVWAGERRVSSAMVMRVAGQVKRGGI
jgi:hypothetical protein